MYLARSDQKLHRIFLIAIAGLFAIPLALPANTVYWNGGADSNWTTAANWSTGALPGTSDDVLLNEDPYGSPYTVTLASGTQSIDSLTTDSTSNLNLSGGTLSIASASTINGTFTLAGGTLTGAGNLTLNSNSNVWSTGEMSGSGTTIISSGATLNANSSGSIAYLNRTLQNDGTINWSGNSYLFLDGGMINNDAQGIFNASGNSIEDDGGTNVFNNAGILNKTGAIDTYIYVPFNNSGTVDVQSQTLALGNGTHSGTFTVENAATLKLGGNQTFDSAATIGGAGNLLVNGGTITDAATVNIGGDAEFLTGTATFNNTFTAGGTTITTSGGEADFNSAATFPNVTDLDFGFGTVNFNSTVSVPATANLNISSTVNLGANSVTVANATISSGKNVELTGSGNLTVTGNLDWSFGTMDGTGTTIVSSGTNPDTATMNLHGGSSALHLNRTLENDGLANWTTGSIIMYDGTLDNNGTLIINGNASLYLSSSLGVNAINNSGSIVKEGTSSVFFSYGPAHSSMTFENSGAINVQAGTLQITDFSNSGKVTIDSGGTFEAFGSTVTNTGTINVAGGTLLLDQGLSSGDVRQQLLSGSDGGEWDGQGIISSLAAADSSHATAVGYTTDGTAYTLMYTWLGDTDLNGVVNYADLQNMAPVGTTDATWSEGDFNYDGVVNADDYSLLLLVLAESGGANISTTLPEPGMVLFALMIGLLPSRKRFHP